MAAPARDRHRQVLKPWWVGPVGCVMVLASAVLLCIVMAATLGLVVSAVYTVSEALVAGLIARPVAIITLGLAFLLGFAWYSRGVRRRAAWRTGSITAALFLVAFSLIFAQVEGELEDALGMLVALAALHLAIWVLVALVRGYDRLWSDALWRARHLANHRCPWCGYDTRGLSGSHRCPECGEGLP
ncbi:MAG: hypothetical protein ACYTGP_12120 [Planctomycetota bacterium]|jgi:hypothetical protein